MQTKKQIKKKKQKISRAFEDLKSRLCSYTQDNLYLLRPFITLFLIYLLAISAILLAGVHYADDIARTSYGYAGWSGFSRYLSEVLSRGLHADNYLSNIAPLPQIIAVGLLAITSVIMICLISGKEIFQKKWTTWIWRVIAVTPLGLCPYFLECLSYQYDAPYMALSILFVMFPLIFRKKSRKLYLTMVIIGTLGMCMTYQASAGIFLVLIIFLSLKDWSEGDRKSWQESLKFLMWSGVGFSLAILLFSETLMIPNESYVSNDTIALNILFSEFGKHVSQYFNLVIIGFKSLWLILIGIIGFCFVLFFALRSKQNKIIATFVAIAGLILMLIAVYAPYSVLEKPLYATRAMYAIGSVIATLGIYIVSEHGWQRIAKIPVFILAWCFFVFAFKYGNILKEQNEYHNMQVNMVISDLNELLPTLGDERKNIQINGQIGYSPVITNMPDDNYIIIHRLIKSSFGRNTAWMAYRLTEGPLLPGTVHNPKIDLRNKDLPVLKETVFYTIKGNSDDILIDFKGEQMDVNY